MAENIVESIIVKLGLDSRDYERSAKKVKGESKDLESNFNSLVHVLEDIRENTATAADHLDGMASKQKKLSEDTKKSTSRLEGLNIAISKAVGVFKRFFAVIAASFGIAKLVEDVQKLNNELFFLEKNLGMSSQSIKNWQNAAGAMGGSAQGMTSSMKSLNMGMNDFVMMGDTSLLPFMNVLGVSMVDAQGKIRDTDEVMLDLADSFSEMDREQAFSIASKMGIDEGTFNTLVQGRQEMEKMLDYQSKMYKSSEAELKASRELAQNRALLGSHWESLKTMMVNSIVPLFVKLSKVALGVFEYLQNNKEVIQAVFKGIATTIGLILLPMLAKATLAALAFIAPFAPFIITVGLLGAAFGLLYNDYKVWAEGGKSLFDWGAFRDYIDNATLSTDNLKNAFKNLTKDMITSTIPTLKGYADIIKLLSQGEFRKAGALAAEMMVNFGEKVGNVIDDVTGNKQGTFIETGRNMVGRMLDGSTPALSSPAVVSPSANAQYSGGSNPLLELLNKGETGGKKGAAAYNTAFTGMRIKAPKPLTQMTIGEVKEWQKANIREQKARGIPADRRSSAAGRYQVIYTSMGGYQKGAGLKDSDLFSQENQDKMAMAMMMEGRYGLKNVKSGKATADQFLDNILAPQWASVQNSRGIGVYDKKGFNKATITPRESKRAIQEFLGMGGGAKSAQASMRQGDYINLSQAQANKPIADAANKVDVSIGNVTIQTSSSTMTGTGQDLAQGVQNQFYQFQSSFK